MLVFRNRTATLKIFVLAMAFVGPALAGDGNRPQDAVWDYIDAEFEAAARDSTYWKRRWQVNGDLERGDVRLGKPYSHYRLNREHLETFVRSGDLVSSASLMEVAYPVFRQDELIGSIQVLEKAGRWVFGNRHFVGGAIDSLGAAHGEKGDSIAALSSKPLGVFLLITPAGSAEMRVYPVTQNEVFNGRADARGSVSYKTACELLRPVADNWLKQHPSPGKNQ